MGHAARTEQLVKNIARLRRAERVPAVAADIAPVRGDLEADVGPALSRAMAARVLGVSQTALDRWIASGDIPTVIAPTGRTQVPRQVVVELAEAIGDLERQGRRRHPLAAALHDRRARGERLGATLGATARRRGGSSRAPRDHRTAELRSLAYHRVVAARLDDRLVREARQRIHQWLAQGRIHPVYARRWEEVLSRPIPRIAELISQDTQDARDLRQNSPFAGVLTDQERRQIIEQVR